MREPTIARNYAEALFQFGERHGATQVFADLLEAVAGAVEADERVRLVLDSPRVTKANKQALLARALAGRAPDGFVRFLMAVVRRGRQGIIPAISREYLSLVDVKLNRVHAGVAIARAPDESLRQEITRRLSKAVGKEVIAHFREDPALLGGVVIRIGDTVRDGSVRRKLVMLRRKMLQA